MSELALTSAQRKQLRSMAHHLEPMAYIGKQGVTDSLVDSIEQALNAHELIKIRFVDRKQEKKTLTAEIVDRTHSGLAGIIGHVAIVYRPHPEEEKRRIRLA